MLRELGFSVFQELVKHLHLMLDPDWMKIKNFVITPQQQGASFPELSILYLYLCLLYTVRPFFTW